jgi:CubicO group peptidase (beta-lactamase class C family)
MSPATKKKTKPHRVNARPKTRAKKTTAKSTAKRTQRTRGGSLASKERELSEFVRKEMHRLRVPGVAVGVLHEGREFTKGFGITNIESPVEVNEETLFHIGSTSKTFTATAMMQLVEKRKVNLRAPVRRYLKDLKLSDESVAKKVTPWHLLTHTGGWLGDFFQETGRGDDAIEKVVEKLVDVPQLTPLGQTWSYNNAGFYIAGRVIEVVTGKPYEAVIKESIFEPLEMDHSFFFPEEVMAHRFVVGHVSSEREIRVVRQWAMSRSVNPAGGITSNVVDQLKYARFWLNGGKGKKRILSKKTMDLMQSEQAPAGSIANAVGLSWLLRSVGGARIVAHGGTTPGQLSAFSMIPERDFAITVLTNSTTGGQLHGAIVQWAQENILGLKDPDPVPMELPAEALEPYTGVYQMSGAQLKLSLEDGKLVASFVIPQGQGRRRRSAAGTPELPPPVKFELVEEDRVFVPEGPYKGTRGEFIRNPDGTVAWLRFGGRIIKRADAS